MLSAFYPSGTDSRAIWKH